MGIPIISDLVESTIGKVVDKALAYIPDPQLKAQAAKEIRDAAKDIAIAQIEVNKVEAANPNVFVAGARPFVIWVGGSAFAYQLLLQPLITTTILIFDPAFPIDRLPKLDLQQLGKVLLGLLGLSF